MGEAYKAFALKAFRKAHRVTITPDDAVVVVGEPSSGTRLLTRIISASGMKCYNDFSHGRATYRTAKTFVRIVRNRSAVEQSQKARWPEIDIYGDLLRSSHEKKYPNALVVSYEEIISDLPSVIRKLAEYLCIEPWEFNEDIYDGNVKWIETKTTNY